MIPFVTVPGGGAIGVAPCPGTSTRRPDALLHDIQAIHQQGPTALVSLVPAGELLPGAVSVIREVSERV